MRIGVLGAGHIGGNLARLLAGAGHDVVVSFATDAERLAVLAADIGAHAGTPAQAAAHGQVVVLSVPWGLVDAVVAQAGDLGGKIVIDTTNQFGRVDGEFRVLDLGSSSAARHNAAKAPAARWVKAFNTLTAGFQTTAAGRPGADRVVMFHAHDDAPGGAHDDGPDLTVVVEALINDAGFDPVRTGTLARNEVGHQEPRGDLYGEEFHHDAACAAVARLRGTPPSGTGRP